MPWSSSQVDWRTVVLEAVKNRKRKWRFPRNRCASLRKNGDGAKRRSSVCLLKHIRTVDWNNCNSKVLNGASSSNGANSGGENI